MAQGRRQVVDDAVALRLEGGLSKAARFRQPGAREQMPVARRLLQEHRETILALAETPAEQDLLRGEQERPVPLPQAKNPGYLGLHFQERSRRGRGQEVDLLTGVLLGERRYDWGRHQRVAQGSHACDQHPARACHFPFRSHWILKNCPAAIILSRRHCCREVAE